MFPDCIFQCSWVLIVLGALEMFSDDCDDDDEVNVQCC